MYSSDELCSVDSVTLSHRLRKCRFSFFIAAYMWWSNQKINNYLKRQLATEQKRQNDTSTVAAGWDHFKINKIKRRLRIADYKNTVWCHHLPYKTIAWQEFLLYLLSAMFSSSSDEELCAQCSTGSAVNLPTDAMRPRRHHESKAFRLGITDVLRLGEVNISGCASWLQPSRQCEGAGGGGKGLWFSSSVSVFQAVGARRGTLLLWALQNWAHMGQTKSEEPRAGLSPRLPQRVPESSLGGWQRVITPTVGAPASDATLVILIYRTL